VVGALRAPIVFPVTRCGLIEAFYDLRIALDFFKISSTDGGELERSLARHRVLSN
jgi:hypothetical protein